MDTNPQMEMIKQTLQKVIDEMTALESQRILPEGHPAKAPMAPQDVQSGTPDIPATDDSAGDTDVDPAILSKLMDKAGQADADGMSPEDAPEEFPPEITAAINAKKKPVTPV